MNGVVCICAAVTEGTLLEAIRCGASGSGALMARTGAGMTCGDCREDLEELIEEATLLPAGMPAAAVAGGEGCHEH